MCAAKTRLNRQITPVASLLRPRLRSAPRHMAPRVCVLLGCRLTLTSGLRSSHPGHSRLPELQPNCCVQPRLPPLVAGWPRSAGYPRQKASPCTAYEIRPRPRSVLTLRGEVHATHPKPHHSVRPAHNPTPTSPPLSWPLGLSASEPLDASQLSASLALHESRRSTRRVARLAARFSLHLSAVCAAGARKN